MSASLCSSPRRGRRRVVADRVAQALAFALALVAGWTPDASAKRVVVERDSVGIVRRIKVGEDGVEIIDRSGNSKLSDRVRIRSGTSAVRVEVDSDSLDFSDADGDINVRVPGVTVDVNDEDIVRIFSDADVPRGERVDGDVVAIMGSVTVEGKVTGDVVAVMGSVRMKPGASVDGDVVAIGGGLDQPPGASVGGESVSLGFFYPRWGAPTAAMLVSAVLICGFLSLILGGLIAFLFPTRLLRIAATVSGRPGASFALGIVSAPLLVVTILLLLITVIGIPIAFLLPFIYVFAAWVGHLAATYVLGTRVLRRPAGGSSPMIPLLVGTAFVALFFVVGILLAGPDGPLGTVALFFNLLGALLVIGLSVMGTGAVLVSRFGSRPRDIAFVAPGGPSGVIPGVLSEPSSAPPVSEISPLPPTGV